MKNSQVGDNPSSSTGGFANYAVAVSPILPPRAELHHKRVPGGIAHLIDCRGPAGPLGKGIIDGGLVLVEVDFALG